MDDEPDRIDVCYNSATHCQNEGLCDTRQSAPHDVQAQAVFPETVAEAVRVRRVDEPRRGGQVRQWKRGRTTESARRVILTIHSI